MSELYVCPQCGSAAVDYSSLSGGVASCRNRSCRWEGPKDDLLLVAASDDLPMEHTLVSLAQDIRSTLSGEVGVALLRFLVKWGFVEVRKGAGTDKKAVAGYLAAISVGVLNAVLKERSRQVTEAKNG